MTRPLATLVFGALLATAPLHAQQPWLRAETLLERDDQVRNALQATAEYGRYLGPNVTLGLTVAADRITGSGLGSAPPETSTAVVGLNASLAFPSARLGMEFGGGALLGAPSPAGAEPLAHALARLHLGRETALRVRGARERYTATLASLDTLVLTHTVEVALDRSAAPGWAWEVGARRAGFGNANAVTSVYGWVLAPLSHSATHSFRVGYAAGLQDAPHSTWVASGEAPTGSFPQKLPGRYDPYYAPHDVKTHSAIVNGALAAGSAWVLADGSVGVRATETEPVLMRSSPAAPPELTFQERVFTPWRARLSVTAPADDRTWVTVSLTYGRTAFYRVGTARLAFVRTL